MNTTDDTPIIQFDRISKTYNLGHERSNLRSALPGRLGEPRSKDTFQALDRVSFEVRRGEAFGIIGPNGAGKSTALKILAGVVTPTSGIVTRPRRMVSIIELGLGFDPDLTGLENLEYGGALLGLRSGEIHAKSDEIIAFAELEDFMDMPLKRYSTGMVARLGFALATAVPADVFVVDEVLSVGDWGFQRRSLDRMRELHANGATMVFVSHNLWVVNQLCDRALLLNNGRVTAVGPTQRILGIYLGQTPYLNELAAELVHSERPPSEFQPAATEPSTSAPEETDQEVDRTGDQSETDKGADWPTPLPADAPAEQVDADWMPVAFSNVHFEPAEIGPGDPVDVVGEIEVRIPLPGTRFLAAGFWEGFAGFAAPDEFSSEFLETPGRYRFRIHYLTMPSGPAFVTWAVAVVSADEPDDPEQLLPNAIARSHADLKIVGPVTSRPGAYLPREWTVEQLDDEGSAGTEAKEHTS